MSKHNVKVAMQYTPCLQPSQLELFSLAELAGVTAHPQVLRIIIELLSLNVPPAAVYALLREICVKNRSQKDSSHSSSSKSSRSSRAASTTDKSVHRI